MDGWMGDRWVRMDGWVWDGWMWVRWVGGWIDEEMDG